MLSIIDAFDKSIVGVEQKILLKPYKKQLNLEKLIQNNGPQFKAKLTSAIMNELNITHEFGYKNNPNSQAYIESFHAQTQREFVESIEFNNIEDVYRYYVSYIYFYNNLRPHGSLKYLIPEYVYRYYEVELKNNSRKLDNYLVRVKK